MVKVLQRETDKLAAALGLDRVGLAPVMSEDDDDGDDRRKPVCTVSGCSCTGYTSSGTAGVCACGHAASLHS